MLTSSLMVLLSLCLVISPSLAAEKHHCQCKDKIDADDEPEQKQEKEKFKVTSAEDGQKVTETITIDKKKQTETFHVPPFKNLDEADIIHDFKMNLSMYRLPNRKRCYLSPLDPKLSKPRKLSKDLQTKLSDKKQEETKKSESKWEVSEEVKDRTKLSDEMAQLCAKFPIYRIQPAQSTMSVTKVRSKRQLRRICWICGILRHTTRVCNSYRCWYIIRYYYIRCCKYVYGR